MANGSVEDVFFVKELIVSYLKSNPQGLGLTADAGSAQGGQPLVSSFNVIDTSASAGDSVTLPASFEVGTLIFIKNGAAGNSIDVFPASGDDLGAGANTAAALAAGKGIVYIGRTANSVWESLIVGA